MLNMLHHFGVVAKWLCAAAETAAHEGDDNTSTPLGQTEGGIKMILYYGYFDTHACVCL